MIDTSAILAVILHEPERAQIVEMTTGVRLVGPGSVPWEVGNAFSAMLKRKRLTLTEAQKGLALFQGIPIRTVAIDLTNSLRLAHQAGLYAYDAYFLDCALKLSAPLLTLDAALKRAAVNLNIAVLEV